MHIPVMLEEVLEVFRERTLKVFFDGTLGAGGHAKAILEAHPELELYIGCDRDPSALERARKTLAEWESKLRLEHGTHREIAAELENIDGVLIDAGVSSMQLDLPERGFSFMKEGPLDMRMDPTARLTAAEIVNRWPEEKLVKILREYGEEPRARAVVRAILESRKRRPFRTTKELADVVMRVAKRKKHLHPATLTFQALRIAVNDEIGELERGIEGGIQALQSGGRIVVISFHRLEDRVAKTCFKKHGLKKTGGDLRILTKKPLEPTEKEIRANPRCRSAKLRAGEKVESDV